MYWTHKERKSIVSERSIANLQNKIPKYVTSISKTVYVDDINYKLDDIKLMNTMM